MFHCHKNISIYSIRSRITLWMKNLTVEDLNPVSTFSTYICNSVWLGLGLVTKLTKLLASYDTIVTKHFSKNITAGVSLQTFVHFAIPLHCVYYTCVSNNSMVVSYKTPTNSRLKYGNKSILHAPAICVFVIFCHVTFRLSTKIIIFRLSISCPMLIKSDIFILHYNIIPVLYLPCDIMLPLNFCILLAHQFTHKY